MEKGENIHPSVYSSVRIVYYCLYNYHQYKPLIDVPYIDNQSLTTENRNQYYLCLRYLRYMFQKQNDLPGEAEGLIFSIIKNHDVFIIYSLRKQY